MKSKQLTRWGITVLLVLNLGLVTSRFRDAAPSDSMLILVPVSPAIEHRIRATSVIDVQCPDACGEPDPKMKQRYDYLVMLASEQIINKILQLQSTGAITFTESEQGRCEALTRSIATRQATIMDLRNQRHALNTSLMKQGVALTALFTPEQREHILNNRDAITWKLIGQQEWSSLIERLARKDAKPE